MYLLRTAAGEKVESKGEKQMMYELLKAVRKIPLVKERVNIFLYASAQLAVLDIITSYDWQYLATLFVYRLHRARKEKST